MQDRSATFMKHVVFVIVGASLIVGACAKRPDVSVATAPPPAPPPMAVTPPPAPAPAPPPAPVVPPPPAVAAPPAVAPSPPPAVAAPTPPRPTPREFMAHEDVKTIHFAFDSDAIRPGDAKILDANATWLNEHAGHVVLIEGHCDERGTSQYNLVLGERRAAAARNYLVQRGVEPSRISVISYGEELPACTDHDEACWARNRRAQFKVKER